MKGTPVTTDIAAAAKDVDLDWVREKYRAEREKRLHPGRLAPVPADHRGARPLRRRPVHAARRARAVHDHVESPSSAAASAACCRRPAARGRASTTSGSSSRAATSAAPGTGTATRARSATPSRTSTCRCSRRSGYIPTEKYAKAPEIFEHCQRIARALRPLPNALFQTAGHRARLGRGRRAVDRLDRPGRRVHGPLRGMAHRAAAASRSCPGVPGIETFEGHTFHTSRWDYDYTGGDSDGRPDRTSPTSGSRSSAPARRRSSASRTSAPSAEHLYVFQRTPSAVDGARNRPTDPSGSPSLEPGWQRARMENFSTFVAGGDAEDGPRQRRLDRHLSAARAALRRRPTVTSRA